MTKIEITIENDNEFNTGWLAYVLGLPEPSVEDSPDRHDGWIMGKQSPDLARVRAVFAPVPGVEPAGQPYTVRIKNSPVRVEVVEAVVSDV